MMSGNYRLKRFIKVWIALVLALAMTITLPGEFVLADNAESKEYAGYVYFTVERLTVGQGYIVEPVRVGFYKDDLLATITERVLGKMSTYDGELSSYYLQGVNDGGEPKDWKLDNIPPVILTAAGGIGGLSGRNNPSVLSGGDYCNTSSWLFSLNNTGIAAGAGSYGYKSDTYSYDNNDVVRLQYSLYGYGRDTNTWDSSWGSDPLMQFPDKDGLIRLAADYKGDRSSDAYVNAIKVLEKWDAAAEEIENASDTLVAQIRKEEQLKCTEAKNKVLEYLKSNVKTPIVSSTGGEWSVIALARAGVTDVDIYSNYYANVVRVLKNKKSSKLSESKSTDNSRVILALTAIGADPTDIDGYNLLEPLADIDYTLKQGIMGAVYALLAIDSGNYSFPDVAEGINQTNRELLVEYLLDKKLLNGGFSLIGTEADIDTTALAISALAPYKESNQEVNTAIDQAIRLLADKLCDNGGYKGFEVENSESISQVVCALCTFGMYNEGCSFIKYGATPLLRLLEYADINNGAFSHIEGGSTDQMATEQAAYALVAYDRMLDGNSSLFNMSVDKIAPMYDMDKVNNLLKADNVESPTPHVTLMPISTSAPQKTYVPQVTAVPSPVASNQPSNLYKALLDKPVIKIFNKNGLNYKITGKKSVTCTGYNKSTTRSKLIIPSIIKYKGKTYNVTSIADKAFKSDKYIKYVSLGKNIKKIGYKSFYKCKRLKKVKCLSKRKVVIGLKAFDNIKKVIK